MIVLFDLVWCIRLEELIKGSEKYTASRDDMLSDVTAFNNSYKDYFKSSDENPRSSYIADFITFRNLQLKKAAKKKPIKKGLFVVNPETVDKTRVKLVEGIVRERALEPTASTVGINDIIKEVIELFLGDEKFGAIVRTGSQENAVLLGGDCFRSDFDCLVQVEIEPELVGIMSRFSMSKQPNYRGFITLNGQDLEVTFTKSSLNLINNFSNIHAVCQVPVSGKCIALDITLTVPGYSYGDSGNKEAYNKHDFLYLLKILFKNSADDDTRKLFNDVLLQWPNFSSNEEKCFLDYRICSFLCTRDEGFFRTFNRKIESVLPGYDKAGSSSNLGYCKHRLNIYAKIIQYFLENGFSCSSTDYSDDRRLVIKEFIKHGNVSLMLAIARKSPSKEDIIGDQEFNVYCDLRDEMEKWRQQLSQMGHNQTTSPAACLFPATKPGSGAASAAGGGSSVTPNAGAVALSSAQGGCF